MIGPSDAYRYLRAQTDCFLGVFGNDSVTFYGPDAEKVAHACGLPLHVQDETLLKFCRFSAEIRPKRRGDWDEWHLLFDERWRDAIYAAGCPFAVACVPYWEGEDPPLRIIQEFRPRLDQPPLRGV
jgi:hypothetical protein